ncbi:MAG: DUF3631 domain-containing protein [Candidatus Competibacteraceae bacterium]
MSNAKPNRLDKQLLTDLQRYFAEQPATHYPTEQLLNYLAGIHTAPWATFAQGKAITARHLARLLQPYGIVSKNIRVGNTVPKCYRAADFNDAFADAVAAISNVAANVAAIPDDVAANVADNVADNVVDKVDVSDNVADVADNVAANSDDVADNLADHPSGIADHVLDATRNQLYRLGASLTRGYEATGNPFSHAHPSEIQHWRDLADLMRKAAESIDSFTATTRPTLTLIQGGTRTVAAPVAAPVADKPAVAAPVADNVVIMTRAAVTATDHLAAAAPARPTRKWPPPKGWAWNHQTGDYEPPKPTIQPEPMDQETIRQTLHVDPSLQYLPGYGLTAV